MMAASVLRRRASDALLATAVRVARRPEHSPTATMLVFQPDHLGDIILSQPAVRVLRAAFPEHRLIAVVGPWSAEIAKLAWPVDAIETVVFPGFDRSTEHSPAGTFRLLDATAPRIAEYHASIAVVLRPDDRWSAAAASAAGVPEVITGDAPEVVRFATRVAPASQFRHRAAKSLTIAATAATAALDPRDWNAHPLRVSGFESAAPPVDGLSTDVPYAVIHPGSGVPVKHWLLHRWRAVASFLTDKGIAVVTTGSGGDARLCTELSNRSAVINLAGSTDLRQLAALMSGARIALGTDNGPMHLAVAVGTPTLTVFGPSNPEEFGPWGDPRRHRIVHAGIRCPKCYDLSASRPEGCGCMVAVTTRSVVSTLDEMLI